MIVPLGGVAANAYFSPTVDPLPPTHLATRPLGNGACPTLTDVVTVIPMRRDTMSHLETVRKIYERFARGDVPTILATFDEDIEFRLAQGHPYQPDGKP